MNAQPARDTRLDGRALILARIAWLVVVVLGVGLAILSIPPQFTQYQTVCSGAPCANLQLTPQEAQELQQFGLSLSFYATYFTALGVFGILVFSSVGALIFWRKSDDRMALFASFMLVTFGIGGSLDVVREAYPGLHFLTSLFQAIGNVCIVLFFFIFPDGRFVPRWTRGVALLVSVREALNVFVPDNALINNSFLVEIPILLLILLHRYWRVSTLVQRQQTKWVVFGATVAVGGYAGLLLIISILFSATGYPITVPVHILGGTVVSLILWLLPFSIGMAILRSHLWDIDLIIRRTLIYGALTASLAAVYFASVVVLQRIFSSFSGQLQSELVTVVSTLVIAALFVPLRSRIQTAIDRRFYRRKYDVSRVLASFSAMVRDEVDLNRLTERLLDVVDATMQPTHASLWLRPTADRRRPPADGDGTRP